MGQDSSVVGQEGLVVDQSWVKSPVVGQNVGCGSNHRLEAAAVLTWCHEEKGKRAARGVVLSPATRGGKGERVR